VTATPLDIALNYIQRGWNPVPIPLRAKKPDGARWQQRVITAETAPRYFNGGPKNIGVMQGPSSGGLNDVDLDCPEAIALAPHILPRTDAVFGRASKRRSHYLYRTDLASKLQSATEPFKDPTRLKSGDAGIRKTAMLVELRTGGGSKGAQTVFPGSVHESGEAIEWELNGEPAVVDGDDLLVRVRKLAAYSLLVRYWPRMPGNTPNRHDCALALGGFLARTGETAAVIKETAELITRTAGDPDWRDRGRAAKDAAEAHSNGQNTYGLPTLLKLLDASVINCITEWLGYRGFKTENGLPNLLVNDSDPTATAKELAGLIAARDDFLFNGNAPVRAAVEANGMPHALEITPEAVRVLAHEICNPIKRLKHGDIPVALKTDIANIYLHGLEGRWGLKPFQGITTAPVLGDDGSIRSASGYDAVSGLWCHNIPTLDIPERPNGREAKAALERLRFAFRTFPFADSERVNDPVLGVEVVDQSKPAGLDESTFHAALLTGVCRQSLELAPGFLCDAPSISGAGTGKGQLVKAICVIASGVRPAAFTSGHDAGEFDKRLTAALIEAHPAVFLDNFNSKELKSDILASALTENPAMVRLMGHSKMVPLHVRTFIGITGNGLQIAEDMARRILACHLDAQMENPEAQPFQPGFLDEIFAQRASLLSDVLIIWRYGRQNPGALKPGRALGSYEVWCQWVRDPLLALGMKDPVDRLKDIKASDPRRRALTDIFEVWWKVHKSAELKATELDPQVIEQIDENACLNEDGSLRFSRQRVAKFLTRYSNTRVGGYLLSKITHDALKARPTHKYCVTGPKE
jgi:hypothetical protein